MVVAYEQAFAGHGVTVAQVLLTHAELADRKRYLNAQRAMDAMIELGAVPIINENDTVSTEEIEFGDNDQLAAMVAPLVHADLLVLLTDVEGLLDAQKQRVSVVPDVAAIRSADLGGKQRRQHRWDGVQGVGGGARAATRVARGDRGGGRARGPEPHRRR